MMIPSLMTTPASPSSPMTEGMLRLMPSSLCPSSAPRMESGITDITISAYLILLKMNNKVIRMRNSAMTTARFMSAASWRFFSFSPSRSTRTPCARTCSMTGAISPSTCSAVVLRLSTEAKTERTAIPSSFSIFSKSRVSFRSTTSVSLTKRPSGSGYWKFFSVAIASLSSARVLISITPFSPKVIARRLSRKYAERVCATDASSRPSRSP